MFSIPIYKPNLSGNERVYVNRCLDSSWISSKGEFVDEFETRFGGYTGAQHSISVCNGTVALHVALLALGIGEGDEVIVPTLTYIASVNAIAYTDATPVFAESLAETWQVDPQDVERRITSKTKAIMAVHLYGQPCDMHALKKIAHEHGLLLIEDCAEALGSKIDNCHVGSFGEIATYSFYGNKTVTTGEGGMVTTGDASVAERVRHLKGQGLAKNREYWHDVVGYNYRMTNICAAIGLAQLERIDDILKRKREIALLYQRHLKGSEYEIHREAPGTRHSYWMVSVLLPGALNRDTVRRHLSERGIETRPLFYPIHTMSMYAHGGEHYEVAENLAARGINLPSYPDLSDESVEYICDALRFAAAAS